MAWFYLYERMGADFDIVSTTTNRLAFTRVGFLAFTIRVGRAGVVLFEIHRLF